VLGASSAFSFSISLGVACSTPFALFEPLSLPPSSECLDFDFFFGRNACSILQAGQSHDPKASLSYIGTKYQAGIQECIIYCNLLIESLALTGYPLGY